MFCSVECAKIPDEKISVKNSLPLFSEAERSIMLYLFDALQVAPEKSSSLIKIVNCKDRSAKFKNWIYELNQSDNILETVKIIRESLR